MGASASVGTGVFVLDPYQRFVMIRRARGCGKGCWSLPGGRLENGETPAEAAIREVKEEIGVTIVEQSINEIAVTQDVHSCCGIEWRTHWFTAQPLPGYRAPYIEEQVEEVMETTWATMFSLPEPLWQPHWAQLGQALLGGGSSPRIMPGQGPGSPE